MATPITTPSSPVTGREDEKRSERDEQDRDDEPGVELGGLGDHHGEPCTWLYSPAAATMPSVSLSGVVRLAAAGGPRRA